MTKVYLAYRLPNTEHAQYLIGFAQQIQSLSAMKDEGVIIHSFDGQQKLFVQDLQNCSPSDFDFKLKEKQWSSTAKTDYLHAFSQIQAAFEAQKCDKVILSRLSVVPTQESPIQLFERLNQKYSNTFNYLLFSEEMGCWMGATPEILVSRKMEQLQIMSLAGTKAVDAGIEWTAKEKEEQQYVTDYVLQLLKNHQCENIEANGPKTIQAGYVEHLQTILKAQLGTKTNFSQLLEGLHPTPAVCGIPTPYAKELIAEVEQHARQLYTGFIGILGRDEQTFFVNLRCMELSVGKARLYLGGGITAASEAEAEWQETEFKAQTLKAILEN